MSFRAKASLRGPDDTLHERDFVMPSPEARTALGRLAALELASFLGLRPARCAIAVERQSIFKLRPAQLRDVEQSDDRGRPSP